MEGGLGSGLVSMLAGMSCRGLTAAALSEEGLLFCLTFLITVGASLLIIYRRRGYPYGPDIDTERKYPREIEERCGNSVMRNP